MGERENCLRFLFQQSGASVSVNTIHRLKSDVLLNSKHYESIKSIYKKLGGILDITPCNLVPWDMEVNNIAVELDEERHFNRYRNITLSSELYSLTPSFPLHEYRSYCVEYESKCLNSASFGGYWTNKSCEKQFGIASEPGELNGNGSPRWKQRAFYDYLRDISPIIIDIQLARISVYDTVIFDDTLLTVSDILDKKIFNATDALLKLVEQRISYY